MPTKNEPVSTKQADPSKAAAGASTEVDEEDVETLDDTELDALLAIGQLDFEAAVAYEIAAEAVDEPTLQTMLQRFAGDHRAHVERIEQLSVDRGMPARIMPPEPDRSVLLVLATAMSAIEPAAAVAAMIANEHLTNATYETAQWLATDAEAIAIVEKHREDEQRHLAALLEYARKTEDM